MHTPVAQKSKLYPSYWSPKDCASQSNALFVFGDNDMCTGLGGQAIIRHCVNSHGIPTKKKPSHHPNAFYIDKEFEENISKINIAIKSICKKSADYDIIYFPKNGFGTGLAALTQYAPKTLATLNQKIYDTFGISF